MKKLFGFNLDQELKDRLADASKKKYTNSSNLLNQILSEWLNNFEGLVEEAKPEKKSSYVPMTEEQRLEEWEWRKNMVEQGKFPVHMADERPVVELPKSLRQDVYKTTDGKVLAIDKSNSLYTNPIPADEADEAALFEESLAMSLAEKE